MIENQYYFKYIVPQLIKYQIGDEVIEEFIFFIKLWALFVKL